MQRTRFSWLLAALTTAGAAVAADGSYDPTFGAGGRLAPDISPGSDFGVALLIQRDGKLLVEGACQADLICAARLLPNGNTDKGFGPASHPGRVLFSDMEGYGKIPVALTTDGGSVFAGRMVVSPYNLQLTKLNAAGALLRNLTLEFSSSINFFEIEALRIQADGKIIIAGNASIGKSSDFAITRVLADLSGVDLAFGDANGTKLIAFPGTSDDRASAIAIQADGRIVVVGGASGQVGAVRLRANGQLDNDPSLGFGDGGRAIFNWGAYSGASAVALDRGGSLLLAGFTRVGTGPTADYDFFVNRLTPRGQQDPQFGLICPPPLCSAGPVHIDFGDSKDDAANALTVQSDGKILVAGGAARIDNGSYFAIARLLPNGMIDTSFGNGGKTLGFYGGVARYDTASAIAIGNGGIMIAGASKEGAGEDFRFGIAKLKLDLLFSDGVE